MKINLNKRINNRESGFSLAELMIAVTIGLLILAGLSGVFSTTSKSRGEVERANRQVENGRYAMQVLTEDLKLAGYFGELDPSGVSTVVAKPDACLTAVADLRSVMALHVQGYDNGDAAPSCLPDVRSGTDIIVIRRASTCIAGTSGCDTATAGRPYFQTTLCYPPDVPGASTTPNPELATPDTNDDFVIGTDPNALPMRRRACDPDDRAPVRRFITHIYFIANNNTSGDGIPTLKRAELGGNEGSSAFTIVPLVEGIENLQFEYGIDTDASGTPNGGSPNAYTAAPDSFNTCVGEACVDNWRSVVSVKVHLLARNTEKTPGYTDTKTYTLGLNAIGAEETLGPFNDGYKRHVYQSSVRLNNPAGRREP